MSPEPALKTTNGYYCGTKVENSWWKKYRPWGFFTRGNGIIWADLTGLYFRLYLTSSVRHLPANLIHSVTIGDWPGKWIGAPVIRIKWLDGGKNLLSGFAVSKSRQETERWFAFLTDLVGNKSFNQQYNLNDIKEKR